MSERAISSELQIAAAPASHLTFGKIVAAIVLGNLLTGLVIGFVWLVLPHMFGAQP